jgi:hypothetical protein
VSRRKQVSGRPPDAGIVPAATEQRQYSIPECDRELRDLELEIACAEQQLVILHESKDLLEKRHQEQLEDNERSKRLRDEKRAEDARAEDRRLMIIRQESLRKIRLRDVVGDSRLPDWHLPRQSYRDDA